jgi:hypothetical protein
MGSHLTLRLISRESETVSSHRPSQIGINNQISSHTLESRLTVRWDEILRVLQHRACSVSVKLGSKSKSQSSSSTYYYCTAMRMRLYWNIGNYIESEIGIGVAYLWKLKSDSDFRLVNCLTVRLKILGGLKIFKMIKVSFSFPVAVAFGLV